ISSMRACTVTAREYGEGAGSRSMTRASTPWRANESASMVPAAPAPTTSTDVSADLVMSDATLPGRGQRGLASQGYRPYYDSEWSASRQPRTETRTGQPRCPPALAAGATLGRRCWLRLVNGETRAC